MVKELWQIIMKLCRLCICMQYYSTTLELIGEEMEGGEAEAGDTLFVD